MFQPPKTLRMTKQRISNDCMEFPTQMEEMEEATSIQHTPNIHHQTPVNVALQGHCAQKNDFKNLCLFN